MYTILIADIVMVAAIYYTGKQKQFEKLLWGAGIMTVIFYALFMLTAKVPFLLAVVAVFMFNFNTGMWTIPAIILLFMFVLGVM